MRKLCIPLAAVVLSLGLSSCKNVTSTRETASNVTGEVWYVKSVGFMWMTFKYQIFYCPATATKGPATCKAAKMYLEGEVPPAEIAKPKSAEERSSEDAKRTYVAAESVGPDSESAAPSLEEDRAGKAPAAKQGKGRSRKSDN